jgi:hypothetical protein
MLGKLISKTTRKLLVIHFLCLLTFSLISIQGLMNRVEAANISDVSVVLSNGALGASGVGVTITFTPNNALTNNTVLEVVYDESFTGVLTDSDIIISGTNISSSNESDFEDGKFRATLSVTGTVTTPVTINIDNNPGLTNPSSAGNYAFSIVADIGGLGTTQDLGATLLAFSGSNAVTVTATIPTCKLTLNIKPEKRIPRVGNWETILNVEVRTSSNVPILNATIPTDSQGTGTYDLCANNVYFPPDSYSFFIKGFSHLRRVFQDTPAFNSTTEFSISFEPEMLAGETSIVYDNYINILDFVTQINNLYSADYKNDLNQDGIVNSLDFNNIITNFYIAGE